MNAGMKEAVFNDIVLRIDEIKKKQIACISNNFYAAKTLQDLISGKRCLSYYDDNCVFILIPFHQSYYDLIFVATGKADLVSCIKKFQKEYIGDYFIRVSIIGKEPRTGEIAHAFLDTGFFLGKKLMRYSKMITQARTARAEATMSTEYDVSLAKEGEEEDILKLLLSEFDASDYNVPELEEIKLNIERKQVVVVRDRGKLIIGLHYFEINNGKKFGLFDVVRKEYRKDFIPPLIDEFLSRYFSENSFLVNRYYGWVDVNNKRLVKFHELIKDRPDGVFINNLRWEKERKA